MRLEAWHSDRIGEVMSGMARVEPRMTWDVKDGVNNAALPPRVDGMPPVVIKFAGGKYGMIDGKHRANRWKNLPGTYAMLVVDAT